MLEFLQTELRMALTFADVASRTSVAARSERSRKEARKAYDTVLRMMNRVKLLPAETAELEERLAALKSELRRLGEIF